MAHRDRFDCYKVVDVVLLEDSDLFVHRFAPVVRLGYVFSCFLIRIWDDNGLVPVTISLPGRIAGDHRVVY